MTAKSKQAQALGIKISRERRAGKNIPPPPKGQYSEKTRQKALRDLEVGRQRKRSKKKTGGSKTSAAKKSAKKRAARKRG